MFAGHVGAPVYAELVRHQLAAGPSIAEKKNKIVLIYISLILMALMCEVVLIRYLLTRE